MFGGTEDQYLKIIEAAHRKRCGDRHFCYVATPMFHYTGRCWRISVTADDISGHIPITEDRYLGSRREMEAEADRLNNKRLDLPRREAARIVAASMANSNREHAA